MAKSMLRMDQFVLTTTFPAAEAPGFCNYMANIHALDYDGVTFADTLWQNWYLIEMYYKWKEIPSN